MRKIISFLLGISLGAGAGVLVVTLFAPVSGGELRQNLRDHVQNAMNAARQASEEKRRELEAELERLRQPEARDTDESE